MGLVRRPAGDAAGAARRRRSQPLPGHGTRGWLLLTPQPVMGVKQQVIIIVIFFLLLLLLSLKLAEKPK